jgi:hypothetical protein
MKEKVDKIDYKNCATIHQFGSKERTEIFVL